jgi:hypothetical protein
MPSTDQKEKGINYQRKKIKRFGTQKIEFDYFSCFLLLRFRNSFLSIRHLNEVIIVLTGGFKEKN